MLYRRFPEIGKYLGQRVANYHGLIDCQLPLAEMRHHGLTGQRDAGFLTPVKVRTPVPQIAARPQNLNRAVTHR
jgi:hypothetical protein